MAGPLFSGFDAEFLPNHSLPKFAFRSRLPTMAYNSSATGLRRFFCGVALVLVFSLVGCGTSDPKNPKYVVAKGKGVKVTRADLDEAENEFLESRGLNFSQIPPDKISFLDRQVLEQLVIGKILVHEAEGNPVKDLDKKVEARVAQFKARFPSPEQMKAWMSQTHITEAKINEETRKQVLVQELIDAKVPPAKDPSDAEIEKFYKDHEQQFNQPAMVRASHVLVMVQPGAAANVKAQQKKKIDDARNRIAKGEDFAKVAKEVSEDKGSAQVGGDLNYFRQGEMVPEFDKVAFSSKIGALSPVFETAYGYHFLKVTDSKPAHQLTLAEAKPQIVSALTATDRNGRIRDYVKNLQKEADVTYYIKESAPSTAPAPSNTTGASAPSSAPAPQPDKK